MSALKAKQAGLESAELETAELESQERESYNTQMLDIAQLPVDLGEEEPVDLAALPQSSRLSMREAGEEIMECYRVLKKGGANIVSEILKGQGTFYEWNHFPDGDVYDPETHAQYYYHAHRGNENEHGHFHTFLRQKGMPAEIAPVDHPATDEWPKGEDALTHFVAISMDSYGFPIRLFTTNRWVTGEAWYRAEDVISMIDCFLIDHAYPSWPVNRWISAMFRLYQPQIAALLVRRDEIVGRWAESRPEEDVYEDRTLEITSFLDISVEQQIEVVRQSLA
jgi:hypothetical protein